MLGAYWDVFTNARLEEPTVFFVRMSLCVRVCVVAIACPSNLCITSRKTTGTVLAQAICASRDSALYVCVRRLSIFFTQVLVQWWVSAQNFIEVRSVVKYCNPITRVQTSASKHTSRLLLWKEGKKKKRPAFFKRRL